MRLTSLYRDIHAPRDLLAELAAERHHGQELVMLTTNWGQLDLALNLVAQLEALGLRHYLLFGDNAQLVEHVRRSGAAENIALASATTSTARGARAPRFCVGVVVSGEIRGARLHSARDGQFRRVGRRRRADRGRGLRGGDGGGDGGGRRAAG